MIIKCVVIGVWAPLDLGGAVTFLSEKFTQYPEVILLKSGCKQTQIA